VANTGTSSNASRIAILSGNGASSVSALDLGDGDDPDIGGIQYYNNQDALIFRTNNTEQFRVDSTGKMGVGTTGPDARLDVLATSGEQLRLTYTDGTVHTGFTVDAAGDLTINASGNNILSGDALNFGGATEQAYNFFAADTSGSSTGDGVGDLYIQDELEVDGTVRFNNITYTFPTTQSSGYVLSTNGSGTQLIQVTLPPT